MATTGCLGRVKALVPQEHTTQEKAMVKEVPGRDVVAEPIRGLVRSRI